MIFPSDCHIHTPYCDGKTSMEQMAFYAFRLGYQSLGFSPHSPLPFRNDYAMKPEQENLYQQKIKSLRLKYQGRMSIHMGIEWDYDTQYGFPHYDYRIGSVHQMRIGSQYYAIDGNPNELKKCIEEGFGGDADSFLNHYFNLVETSSMRVGVDVVGHFDVPFKHNESFNFFDENSSTYREMSIKVVQRIVKQRPDLIFEVNTGAMFRTGRRIPYPAPFILRELAKLRARITLTSDAHTIEALAFWQEGALDLCRRCGHKKIYRLSSNGFIPMTL